MNVKKKKKTPAQSETDVLLDEEIDIHQGKAKHLFTRWENKLHEYEDTALHYQLMSYHRILTRHMDFKDKLIEKLLNELNEFKEHRRRTGQKNLELVKDTLSAFKEETEEIHDQYLIKVDGELPTNLTQLEVRRNENNDCWRILKHHRDVIQTQSLKKTSKLKNKYMGYKDIENGRFESIVDELRQNDLTRYKNMLKNFKNTLKEYKHNTRNLIGDYLSLKEKDGHLSILKIQLNTRIEHLLVTINNLEKELKEPISQKEMDRLIKEKQEFQEGLKKFIKKVATNSECCEKHLSLLCKTTKPIYEKIDDLLKKGDDILKCISLCQKLETPTERAKLWSTGNRSNSAPQIEHRVEELGTLSNFLRHVSDVKRSSMLMDDEINKLNRENKELKDKIRCLVPKKKK